MRCQHYECSNQSDQESPEWFGPCTYYLLQLVILNRKVMELHPQFQVEQREEQVGRDVELQVGIAEALEIEAEIEGIVYQMSSLQAKERLSEQREDRRGWKDMERGEGKESERSKRSERRDKERASGEQRDTTDKPRSLQPSTPIDVPRSSSRGVPRRYNPSASERGDPAASSSPGYPAKIPIPIHKRRETGDTDRAEQSSSSD